MSLLKAYTTSRNNVFTDVSTVARATENWAWLLAHLLINDTSSINAYDSTWTDGLTHSIPAWTCAGSSDSSTGGMDAVNRWPGPFSGLIMANEGSPHAWFVAQSPAGICSLAGGKGPIQVLINLDKGGGANNYQLSLYTSVSGFTGGSFTTRPTATDELKISYAGSPVSVLQNNATAGLTRKMHLTLGQDGSFFMLASEDGTAHAESGLLLIETIAASGRTNNRPFLFASELSTNNAHPPFVNSEGSWTTGQVYANASMVGWSSSGGTKFGFNAAMPQLASLGVILSANATAMQDVEDSKWDDFPMPIVGMNAGQTQMTLVYAVDWALAPWLSGSNTPAQNSTEPSSGQIEATTVGNTFWPTSGTLSM